MYYVIIINTVNFYQPNRIPRPVSCNSYGWKGKDCPVQMQAWALKNKNYFGRQRLLWDVKDGR